MKLSNLIKIIIIYLLTYHPRLFAQVYLAEDFETGTLPDGWTEEVIVSNVSWDYNDGGYGPPPSPPAIRYPQNAHSGFYNAIFEVEEVGPKTKLVTKAIDLSDAKKPELNFYYAQEEWGTGEFDKLRIYYKKHADSSWVLLKEYLERVATWKADSIFLPTSALTSTFYLAFEGESNWGFGVCLDDVEVVERGVIPMHLKNYSIHQPSTNFVPARSLNNPVLRIDVNVYGNTGKVFFDSISVKSLNHDNIDINENGVKLFHTVSQFFSSENQIGSAKNIGDEVTFDNLNYELPYGQSYLWVTFDVDSLAKHGNYIDASVLEESVGFYIDTSGLDFSSTFYVENDSIVYIIEEEENKVPIHYFLPGSDESPGGKRYIEESLFYDNFEINTGWNISNDFQLDTPNEYGGSEGGNPDPASAYSGNIVLGNDLTGLGATQGDYENLISTPYYAESPVIDGFFYQDIKLSFYRWLNLESFDDVSIDLSVDSGYTWQTIYSPTGNVSDNYWNNVSYNLSSYGASRKSEIMIRFGLGPTDGSGKRSGWNVDNFAITGNFIENDAGVTQILTPVSGCGHTSADTVTIIVKNFGGNPIDTIPVSYTFYGIDSLVYDTIYQNIPVGDSITFTFNTPVNLTNPDIYLVESSTHIDDDEDITNNYFSKNLIVQPTISYDFTEDFETEGGLWMVKSDTTTANWEWGAPSYFIVPPSGSKLWMTKLSTYYPNNDSSSVESVCYDFSDGDRKFIELKYWLDSEANKDGTTILYSVDNGITWDTLSSLNEFGWDWGGWYTQQVEALGVKGWSGDSSKWITTRQLLPSAFSLLPSIKFRMAFASNNSNNEIGFAFDDFRIYSAPHDVGVISIDFPSTDCLFDNPDHVTVSVKNYGLNKLYANDTMILGYKLDGGQSVYDTMLVGQEFDPGDTLQFTFSQQVTLSETKTYQISAFTLIEDIPGFYWTNNDTVQKSFDVLPLPITNLPDTIQSKEPDTVVVRAYYDPDYSYWWDGGASTADTFKVPRDGVYHVLVTDTGGNGCSITDSVYVELLFNDIGVDSLFTPVSSCELSDAEYLSVRVRNFGTDSMPPGAKITLSYEINGGAPVSDTIYLSQSLYSGKTLTHTFNDDPAAFSAVGAYNMKLYSYFGGDTIQLNDTLFSSLDVYGYPNVDIGGDTVVEALSYTMDAGPGFVSYSWNGGNTVQFHTVDSTGYYDVMVVDINGCAGYDTAYVRLKLRDVVPNALVYPVSTCEMTGTINAQLQIKNNGNDTIPLGTKIYAKYKLNNNSMVNDSISLGVDLLPGETINHTFTPQEDFSSPDDYIFMLIATTSKDLKPGNDTIVDTISIFPKPEVDFGLGSSYIHYGPSYTLDAGYDDNYSYLWNGSISGGNTYTATEPDIYWVRVTDTRTGCYSGDTVFLNLIYPDIGVTAINFPTEVCTGEYSDILLEISNLGISSIAQGETISIGFMLDGEEVWQEDVNLTQVFVFGTQMNHTLDSVVKLDEGGPAMLTFYTMYSQDEEYDNDSLSISRDVQQGPVIDFGDDNGLLETTLPYVLDAGSGHQSYLWQDASTNQTYTVNNSGTYSVIVTGTNNCQTEKSVQVEEIVSSVINSPDNNLNISIYPNPASDEIYMEIDAREQDDLLVEFYNSEGLLMFHFKAERGNIFKKSYDINNFARGIYHVKVYNKEINHISKVIIY
jgi:hypothetical protein